MTTRNKHKRNTCFVRLRRVPPTSSNAHSILVQSTFFPCASFLGVREVFPVLKFIQFYLSVYFKDQWCASHQFFILPRLSKKFHHSVWESWLFPSKEPMVFIST